MLIQMRSIVLPIVTVDLHGQDHPAELPESLANTYRHPAPAAARVRSLGQS
jgi:hypothetical protein